LVVGVGGSEVGEGDIGAGVNVDGTGVEAGEHPLNTTVSNAKTRKFDRIVFFMTLISFLIGLSRVAPNQAFSGYFAP
jgi:hypothetical protein